MNAFLHIREHLAGAWQLMLGRPEGMSRLDVSLDGFWRSFSAVILILPFAFLSLISRPVVPEAAQAAEPLTAATLVATAFALLVDWFSFPLVFALLARPLGLGARYVSYIVARNWASVVIAAMVAVVHALHLVRVLPSEALPYAQLAALMIALRFSYVLARTVLAVSIAVALPVVVLDLLISLVVWSAFERLT